MIGWLKAIVKALLPLGLYVGTMGTCVLAVAGFPLLAIAAIIVMSPLPNVWYQIHSFPLGKDALDLLVICAFIGLWTGKHIQAGARNNVLLILYIFVTYLAVWNSSLAYNLSLPITPSNPVFVAWKNYVQMIMLYFICYHSLGDEKRQQQIVYLMLFVLFLIAFRDARNFTSGMSFSYDSRAEGPFWQVGLGPNHFGAYIVHNAALALGLGFFTVQRYWRWFFIGTAIISVKPLFSTYSRGAWAAALAVMVVFGVLQRRSLLVVLIALMIGWQTLLPEDVVDRVSMTETTDGELESSAGDRVVLWGLAWDMFLDNPVFGRGLDAFEHSGVGGRYTNVHSLYLETLAELGVIGFIFLLIILLRSMLAGWALFRRGESDFQRGLGLGFLGCVIATIITNLFGDRWSYFAMSINYWILWGIVERALASIRVRAREPAATRAGDAPRPEPA
ncbi:MAG: O-antigen ligase family protein [Pseudomonadota bacterium]